MNEKIKAQKFCNRCFDAKVPVPAIIEQQKKYATHCQVGIDMLFSAMRFAIFLCCLYFSSCAEKQEVPKKIATKPDTSPQLLGRVQSISLKKDYVLIQSYDKWKLDDGAKLFTLAEGRSSALETSGEKLGDYIAADIKSGDVKLGDAVYFRGDTKIEEPSDIGKKTETPKASE